MSTVFHARLFLANSRLKDISDYPECHTCMVFSTSTHDVPAAVSTALEGLSVLLYGMSIDEMLRDLNDSLERALGNKPTQKLSYDDHGFDEADESDKADETDEADEAGDADEDEMDMVDDGLGFSDEDNGGWSSPSQPNLAAPDELITRLANDLTTVKLAGFKVGYLGSKYAPIICVSCRIGKLGISDEAMEAWQVDRRQYLICLLRYVGKYRSFEDILRDDEKDKKAASVEIHVDLCDSYKPTLISAVAAFNQGASMSEEYGGCRDGDGADCQSSKPRQVKQLFISKPLNTLLRDRFIKILRYRFTYGFAWDGAERYFNDIQGKSVGHAEPSDESYFAEETVGSPSTVLPLLATGDHLMQDNCAEKSFPLIAMQFVLRHFVRCTEFCLVCHCKTNDRFEALKPYVCSNSLCLFQYMSLGFGPSLEWEVLSQPTVVDLLVSFTYASARSCRLKDPPTGLGFLVPSALLGRHIAPHGLDYAHANQPFGTLPQMDTSSGPTANPGPLRFFGRLHPNTMELVFPVPFRGRPIMAGDWIAIFEAQDRVFHCRVMDTAIWPTVRLGDPVHSASIKNKPAFRRGDFERDTFFRVEFVVYDTRFDDLGTHQKQHMVAMMLELLPSIDEMQEYLRDRSKPNALLSGWSDRIPKPTYDIMRWIVASNRSCIIQDDLESNPNAGVQGVDGYLQFRFAQGAPDKEERFLQSVAAATAEADLKHPTLFAWHGSPLGNWHGILREGLHFREVHHGRAYGDGVYMSSHFNAASTYMGAAGNSAHNCWPQSKLKITAAISLNEVVNMPQSFVSANPHFVVSQLDWIQTRYLFVQCSAEAAPKKPKRGPAVYYEQDPKHRAFGPSNAPIIIPLTAFNKQRRLRLRANVECESEPKNASSPLEPAGAGQKRKLTGIFSRKSAKTSASPKDFPESSKNVANEIGGDSSASDDTDDEDLDILFVPGTKENKGKQPENSPPPQKQLKIDPSKTDFLPGTLDESTLKLLRPPAYATPGASKALQRELKATLQIQDTHLLHELGWYVDPNLITTVYQWIVELHSFDAELPIAKDLRKAYMTSIVIEIRFGKDYPISPPFVRVIRPRFLGFQQGGGGHVTAGGALCMELLTNSGWSAVSSIESVLLQVRMAISSTDPRPARLERGQDAKQGTVRDYTVGEAVSAYVRACQLHGWEVPKDFQQASQQGWD